MLQFNVVSHWLGAYTNDPCYVLGKFCDNTIMTTKLYQSRSDGEGEGDGAGGSRGEGEGGGGGGGGGGGLVFNSMGQRMLEHSAWIRRLWVRVPLRSRHFLSQQLWCINKNIRSNVENEWCCPRTVIISNVNFTSKISIPTERVLKTWDF